MYIRIGSTLLETAFAWPSGPAAQVLGETEAAMGAVRARVAARMGNPDPFKVRAALAASPGSEVTGCSGRPLTRDAVDAQLLGSADMVGVLAFQGLGPTARSVVPDPSWSWLRWRSKGPPAPPVRTGAIKRYSAKELGDDERATFRCIIALPRGQVAIGSDYGLVIGSASGFTSFPWPAGARRESRRVEAMLATPGLLHVATQQATYTWDYKGEPHVRKHPADHDAGYDDVLALSLTGSTPPSAAGSAPRVVLDPQARPPLVAWRTHLEGGAGPPDILSFATDPNGVVYAGTRNGELWVVDGGGPVHVFNGEKVLREGGAGSVGRPVRHLAFADQHVWAAAAGALHRFDGAAWSSEPGEPGALAADEAGRLWLIRDGGVYVRDRGELRRIEVGLERPWAIAALPGAVWVGGVGGVACVRL